MTEHALQSFFWPQSIAVLGASPDLHRIRGRLLHQLRENGFPGRILPINPSYQEIGGLPCFPSIAAVGAPVDLALVAIPAAGVASALEECAKAGVKNALIISSGFAEEGGAAIGLREKAAVIAEALRLDELHRGDGGVRNHDGVAHAIASVAAPTPSLWPR